LTRSSPRGDFFHRVDGSAGKSPAPVFRSDARALRVGGLDDRISVLAPRDISVAVTTTAGEPDHRVGNVRTSALSKEEQDAEAHACKNRR
jgi:hypothetical protein